MDWYSARRRGLLAIATVLLDLSDRYLVDNIIMPTDTELRQIYPSAFTLNHSNYAAIYVADCSWILTIINRRNKL